MNDGDVTPPMEMAAPPSASPDFPQANQESLHLQLLGVLRTEILDLQNFLDCVRKGEADIKTYNGYIAKTKKDIDDLIAKLPDGSSARHIKNIWEQAGFCPLLLSPNADFPAREHFQSHLGQGGSGPKICQTRDRGCENLRTTRCLPLRAGL